MGLTLSAGAPSIRWTPSGSRVLYGPRPGAATEGGVLHAVTEDDDDDETPML